MRANAVDTSNSLNTPNYNYPVTPTLKRSRDFSDSYASSGIDEPDDVTNFVGSNVKRGRSYSLKSSCSTRLTDKMMDAVIPSESENVSEIVCNDAETLGSIELPEAGSPCTIVESRWCLSNGSSISKMLHQSAMKRISAVENETKLTWEEIYALRLALSNIFDPSCKFHLNFLNVSEDELIKIIEEGSTKLEIVIPEVEVMNNLKIKRVLRLCNNGNFGKALIEAKRARADMLAAAADSIEDENEYETNEEILVVIHMLEFMLDHFQLCPNSFHRQKEDERTSEAEFVSFIGSIFKILLQGLDVSVRIGELKSKDADARRKVDIIVTFNGKPISNGEAARNPPADVKKTWSDRSKVIRLNQGILNKTDGDMVVAFQFNAAEGRFLAVKHVDDGLYMTNGENKFSFPRQREEIYGNFNRMLDVLFYFKAHIKAMVTLIKLKERESKRNRKEARSFIQAQPFWTPKKAAKSK